MYNLDAIFTPIKNLAHDEEPPKHDVGDRLGNATEARFKWEEASGIKSVVLSKVWGGIWTEYQFLSSSRHDAVTVFIFSLETLGFKTKVWLTPVFAACVVFSLISSSCVFVRSNLVEKDWWQPKHHKKWKNWIFTGETRLCVCLESWP